MCDASESRVQRAPQMTSRPTRGIEQVEGDTCPGALNGGV